MKTELLDKLWEHGRNFLGVRYPILCGAMTWISDFSLVKAVHDHGGFGVLAGGNMPPDLFEQEVERCIAGLKDPFGVNLITIAPNFKAHLEILKDKDVPLVVFAGNFPRKREVAVMKDAGKKTMSFASTLSIAEQQIRFGVDALMLEGSEAGGHVGHVSLAILLQQVLFKQPAVPVFVAGGVATGEMIAHLLLMGAAGVQMGTRFVMSEECTAHPAFKERFAKARAREAVTTPTYDRRLPVVPVRALHNASMNGFNQLQLELIQQMNAGTMRREEAQMKVEEFWVGGLRKAVQDGDVEDGSVMAGQSVGLTEKVMPMKDIFAELVGCAETELERVKGLFL